MPKGRVTTYAPIYFQEEYSSLHIGLPSTIRSCFVDIKPGKGPVGGKQLVQGARQEPGSHEEKCNMHPSSSKAAGFARGEELSSQRWHRHRLFRVRRIRQIRQEKSLARRGKAAEG